MSFTYLGGSEKKSWLTIKVYQKRHTNWPLGQTRYFHAQFILQICFQLTCGKV